MVALDPSAGEGGSPELVLVSAGAVWLTSLALPAFLERSFVPDRRKGAARRREFADSCKLLRVSQGTVRKAIDELAAENLLVRRQGKGTFVATHAEQHVQYRFLRLAPDDGEPVVSSRAA